VGLAERKFLPKAKPKGDGETDDLLSKMRGEPTPAAIEESKAAAANLAVSNRGKRRQNAAQQERTSIQERRRRR